MRVEKNKKPSIGLLGLAFVFLIIPSVNVFDILPDFFAYFIIAKRLGYAADRAPFFAEARESFRKLGLATLIKLPASLLMVSFRSENYADNDIRALFAITFAVIEIILLINAISNLFTAFYYLGQRGDNTALIRPYDISKKKKFTPESLKLLTYVFAVYRSIFCFAPECLLLTRTVTASEYLRTFNVARLYPYTVVFGIITSLCFGIVWKKRFKKYLLEIEASGGFSRAVDSMIDDNRREELAAEDKVDKICSALSLLTLCSVLTLEMRFDNLSSINLLPPFAFGFLLLFSAMRISSFSSGKLRVIILGSLFTFASVVRYLFEFRFLEKFGYEALTIDPMAKSSYRTLILAFIVEAVIFVAFAVCCCISLKKFVLYHTGIEPSCDRYSRHDKEYHGVLTTKIYIFIGLSIFTWLAKLTDCILRYFSKNTLVPIENQVSTGGLSFSQSDVGIVNESILPWFGIVVTVASVALIIFSFTFFSQLKEDVRMKYLDN